MGAIRALVDELRRRGATVHEWSGWDGRGNDGVSQITPAGGIIHHTGSSYGNAYPELVSSSQSWAGGGALCNFAGNSDGSFTVIASGLAYHAGGGAGPSLGPLARVRQALNRYSVGLEIVYPGDKPMTDAQYRSALLFAKTVADLFGGGDIECIRAHAETNGRGGDGKWDPGYADGKTIDMTVFRREAATIPQEGDYMALENEIVSTYKAIYERGGSQGDQSIIERLVECQLTGRANARKLDELLGRPVADVNEQELAGALAPLVRGISDAQLTEFGELMKKAVNDERDRRERARLEGQV